MNKIDILIIATNKYVRFLPKLISSIEKHFMPTEQRTIHVFTDQPQNVEILLSQENMYIEIHEVEHHKWPFVTLYRFHSFLKYIERLQGDYQFYIDADSLITSHIGTDILAPIIGVQHCGYVNGGGTFENRVHSRAYVSPKLRKTYFGGGFFGMDKFNFRFIIERAVDMIDEDLKNDIIPVWHDESVLNAILNQIDKVKILSPSYHFPENSPRIWNSWPEQYECKILLLDKNHKELRS